MLILLFKYGWHYNIHYMLILLFKYGWPYNIHYMLILLFKYGWHYNIHYMLILLFKYGWPYNIHYMLIHVCTLPGGDVAVAVALAVEASEVLVLRPVHVEGDEHVHHAVGVVDGLAVHCRLLVQHHLMLLVFRHRGPHTQL